MAASSPHSGKQIQERVLNLTPHALEVRIHGVKDPIIFPAPPKAHVMRCVPAPQFAVVLKDLNVPFALVTPQESERLDGLPEHWPAGVEAIIVSRMVAQQLEACHMLNDGPYVLVPDTGPESAVRSPDGEILAVKRLEVWRE